MSDTATLATRKKHLAVLKPNAAKTRRLVFDDLWIALQRYTRLFQFRDPNNSVVCGLRVNECYVLELLANEGSKSVLEVADALGIHKSNATRITQALEKKKLIIRQSDASDGRVVIWKTSAKGKRLYADINDDMIGRFDDRLSQIPAKDLQVFVRVLKLITEDTVERIKSVDNR